MFLKSPCKSFFTVNVCHKHAFPYSVFMQIPTAFTTLKSFVTSFNTYPLLRLPNRSSLVSPRRDTFLGRPVLFAFNQLATPLLKCLNNVSADSDTCYICEISLIFNPSVFFLTITSFLSADNSVDIRPIFVYIESNWFISADDIFILTHQGTFIDTSGRLKVEFYLG